jgi:hypothetical protein
MFSRVSGLFLVYEWLGCDGCFLAAGAVDLERFMNPKRDDLLSEAQVEGGGAFRNSGARTAY